jgi:hypothetical protein
MPPRFSFNTDLTSSVKGENHCLFVKSVDSLIIWMRGWGVSSFLLCLEASEGAKVKYV